MKIVMILKDHLNRRPPVLSVAKHLIDLHHELLLIVTGIDPETRNFFESTGARCRIITCNSVSTKLSKIDSLLNWLSFRKQVFSIVQEERFDYLWLASADATLALGKALLRYPYILQIQELYDTVPRYRNGLKIFMEHARKVFVPDEVRAHIFRAWYHLKETPVVLPNKPYGHPRTRNLPITDSKAAEAFSKIPANAKILFYQGLIYRERDLRPIARAVEQLNGEIVLAIQGKVFHDDYCKDLFANYHFYYIPYVPAPRHLEITSRVDVGFVSYDHINLNNEFCAPNKIWEYAGFGIPMLGNDVYGLRQGLVRNGIGVSVNQDYPKTGDVVSALRRLLENYTEYSRNASQFFDSVQNEKTLAEVLEELK